MNPPAALLFDLDGTLVDSAVTIALALSELSAMRGGGPADVASVRRLVSKGAPALVRETLGSHAGDSDADIAAFRAILSEVPPQPNIVFPGVVDALTALSAAGHTCAIVTNKPEKLASLLLEQLDLSRFFAAVVGGDTLAVCKPDPAPLRHALMQLGVGEAAAMIGDSEVDADAAHAAAVPFILYGCGYQADGCAKTHVTAVFHNFDELPGLLQQDLADYMQKSPQERLANGL